MTEPRRSARFASTPILQKLVPALLGLLVLILLAVLVVIGLSLTGFIPAA